MAIVEEPCNLKERRKYSLHLDVPLDPSESEKHGSIEAWFVQAYGNRGLVSISISAVRPTIIVIHIAMMDNQSAKTLLYQIAEYFFGMKKIRQQQPVIHHKRIL